MFQRRKNERNPEIPNEYDAELRELARKTQEVRARSAALEQERAHAEALEDERRPYRSSDRPLPLLYWMGWAIADKTRGSARLDLVRPRLPSAEPGNLFRRLVSPPSLPSGTTGPGGPRTAEWRHDEYEDRPRFGRFGFGQVGQGARIKLMRHIDFGTEDQIRGRGPENGGGSGWRLGRRRRVRDYSSVDDSFQNVPDFGTAVSSISDALKDNFKPPAKPWFDFGAGLNLELDEGSLQPTVRLKVKDFFSIKILPEPMFKIQKRFRFGQSKMGVRVNYELPLVDAQNLWAPPARLMVRLDNHMGGLRLGPGGMDFDESVLQLGKSTSVRAALGVNFPNTLPVEEGDKLFSWRARRLGVKTQW